MKIVYSFIIALQFFNGLLAQSKIIDSMHVVNNMYELEMCTSNINDEEYDNVKISNIKESKSEFTCEATTLQQIIAIALSTYPKRISIQDTILLTIKFNYFGDDSIEMHKILIQQVEQFCNIKIEPSLTNYETWELVVTDSVKLNNFRVDNSYKKLIWFKGNEFKSTFEKSAGEVCFVGDNLMNFVDFLNYNIKAEILTSIKNKQYFNFGTISFTGMGNLNKKLSKKLGLSFIRNEHKLTQYIIHKEEL